MKKLLTGNKLLKSPSAGWYSFDSEICSSFGIPEGKIRNAEVNNLIQEHVGDFISLLKQMGKYKVGLRETEVAITEDEIEDEGEE